MIKFTLTTSKSDNENVRRYLHQTGKIDFQSSLTETRTDTQHKAYNIEYHYFVGNR